MRVMCYERDLHCKKNTKLDIVILLLGEGGTEIGCELSVLNYNIVY